MALKNLRNRLMLMRPHNKMEKLRNHAFCDGVPATHAKMHALVLILVQNQYVEPIILVFQRSLELDALVLKGHVESFILHVTDTVESNLSLALPEEDWDHLYVFNVGDLPEVIDVVVGAHQVDVAQVLKPARVIVVPVNDKYRQRHGKVLVHVVRLGVLVRLELDVLLAKNVIVEEVLALPESLAGWFVLME